MRNILIIATEYPIQNSNIGTPVIHFFAKEWRKMGYNVIVIRCKTIFPIYYYWIASIFSKQVAWFVGNYVDTKRESQDIHYVMDDVNVYSTPIFKLIPHGKFNKSTINKQIIKIQKIIQSKKIIPDVIIGHFHNPQIELVSKLKILYPKANSCIVLHESPEHIKKTYSRHYPEYMNNIDIWGFRFKALKENFEQIFGNSYKTFICHSGVPDEFVNSTSKAFSNKVTKFCYIGQLIPLKRVCDTLFALHKAFPYKNFEFNIVGEGFEKKNLESIVQSLEIESNVRFMGKVKRDEVQKIMNDADCFIMVSESEAFGLVYLEAMGKGCITIGTRGQGIDGVIKHEVNGFLCESNNSDELSKIIKHINSLSLDVLSNISKNAIDTANEMTDYKVAKKYINTVLSL